MNIALDWYGIDGTATKLPGEYDSNYRIETAAGEKYLLRVSHETEKRGICRVSECHA
jgi:Ser/Thr protein kinase RdoA (MazF antagonist)